MPPGFNEPVQRRVAALHGVARVKEIERLKNLDKLERQRENNIAHRDFLLAQLDLTGGFPAFIGKTGKNTRAAASARRRDETEDEDDEDKDEEEDEDEDEDEDEEAEDEDKDEDDGGEEDEDDDEEDVGEGANVQEDDAIVRSPSPSRHQAEISQPADSVRQPSPHQSMPALSTSRTARTG